MNAARASCDDKVTEEGFDVMKLTTSGHCCEKCARFEGELFSLTGATKGLPSKDDLIEAGVFHPNCTHSYSLVPDFIRERDYNPDGTRKDEGSKKQDDGRTEQIKNFSSSQTTPQYSFLGKPVDDFEAYSENGMML